MSLLSSLQTYWNATSALSSLGRLYLTSVPDDQSYPYFVVTVVGESPHWYTGSAYYEEAVIQLHAYHTSAATVQGYLETIKANFDWHKYSSEVVACYRENSFLMQEAAKVFHGVVELVCLSQRSL